MKNEYQKQAEKFCKNTNSKISFKFIKEGYYFPGDKEYRNIYRWTIKKDGKTISGRYGDSINNTMEGIKPTIYDLLTCLEKYDPEDIETFCGEYGYEITDKNTRKIYNACVRQYIQITSIYNDAEMEMLREIQ